MRSIRSASRSRLRAATRESVKIEMVDPVIGTVPPTIATQSVTGIRGTPDAMTDMIDVMIIAIAVDEAAGTDQIHVAEIDAEDSTLGHQARIGLLVGSPKVRTRV